MNTRGGIDHDTALGRTGQALLWAGTLLLAATFFGAGLTKLAGTAAQAENFARWGYPSWLLYLTGAVEVGGALLILIPRTAVVGAAGIASVMVGAVATHLLKSEAALLPVPLALLVLAAAVGHARWSMPARPRSILDQVGVVWTLMVVASSVATGAATATPFVEWARTHMPPTAEVPAPVST